MNTSTALRQIACFALCSLLLFLMGTKSIYAQNFSLSWSTPLKELKIMPSKEIQIRYTLTNLGDPSTVRLYIVKTAQKGNTGELVISEYTNTQREVHFELSNPQLQFNKPFLMQTKETREIIVKITTPTDLPQKDYYYSLIASTDPPPALEGTSKIRLQGGIGTHMLISVFNKEQREQQGAITLFGIKPRFLIPLGGKRYIVDKRDRTPVFLTFENQSNRYIKAQGTIHLLKKNGSQTETIQTYTIPSHVLFTGTQRLLKTSSSACPSKNYKELCKNDASLFLEVKQMGIYTLVANVQYGDQNQSQSDSVLFYVIPFWELIGVFCTIFALLLIFLHLHNTKK